MRTRRGIGMRRLPLALGLVVLGGLVLPPPLRAGFNPTTPPVAQTGLVEVTALVIGESLSPSAALVGVAPDVEQIAAALKSLGVATTTLRDADRDGALAAIAAFADDSPEKVHLLYFSGYGGGEAGFPNALLFMSKCDVSRAPAREAG